MRWLSERVDPRRLAAALALLAIVAWTTAYKLPFAMEGKMIGDAPIYLDIARHIRNGDGPILSINFYQDWNGYSTPAPPYQHIGFALFVAAIWAIRHSVAAVSVTNTILSATSLVLYYRLCRIFFSRSVSLVSAALVGVSGVYFQIAILPWPEDLQFFLLMVALLLLWHPRAPAWTAGASGFLLAAGFLVRSANLYSYVATAIAERRRSFFVVSLLCFGAWQGFCWTNYGRFYPGYAEPARVLSVGTFYFGAYYGDHEPYLRLPPTTLFNRISLMWDNMPLHVGFFAERMVNYSGWAFAMAPALLLFLRKKPSLGQLSRGTKLFLLQGLVPLAGYATTFYWLHRVENRYTVWILPWILPPLFEGLANLSWLSNRRVRFAVFAFFVAMAMLQSYLVVKAEPAMAWRLSGIQWPRADAYGYLRSHSGPHDLAATNELGYLYEMERPAVSLPRGLFCNEKNLLDFFRIFKPTWVLVDRQAIAGGELWNPVYDPVIEKAGFRLVYKNFGYWVYSRAPLPETATAPPH